MRQHLMDAYFVMQLSRYIQQQNLHYFLLKTY